MEVIDVLTQLWKSFHSVDGYGITLYTLIYYNFTSQLHLGKAEVGEGRNEVLIHDTNTLS